MSEYLPTDLILEIISRLPTKSIARCRCLSKLWASQLTPKSSYFTELFLTHSKTRPRLLLAVERNYGEWCLYTCPQPQISSTKSKSSISVTAEFYMSLPKSWALHFLSGLIYFSKMPNYYSLMLCNPTTRQFFWLPHLIRAERSYFGYDPVNRQLNVLAICFPSSYQIIKLKSRRLSSRNLDGHLHHYPEEINICINGILYYIANFGAMYPSKIIACFDFHSEKFEFVGVPWPRDPKILVNFKGKLGGIQTKWVKSGEERFKLELSLWVLEDVEKQEWSKHVRLLPLCDKYCPDFSIYGVTTTGEVVLSLRSTRNPSYVYFFNIEKNILQKIEIKGFEGFKLYSSLQGCVDYVEDLRDLNWNYLSKVF